MYRAAEALLAKVHLSLELLVGAGLLTCLSAQSICYASQICRMRCIQVQGFTAGP